MAPERRLTVGRGIERRITPKTKFEEATDRYLVLKREMEEAFKVMVALGQKNSNRRVSEILSDDIVPEKIMEVNWHDLETSNNMFKWLDIMETYVFEHTKGVVFDGSVIIKDDTYTPEFQVLLAVCLNKQESLEVQRGIEAYIPFIKKVEGQDYKKISVITPGSFLNRLFLQVYDNNSVVIMSLEKTDKSDKPEYVPVNFAVDIYYALQYIYNLE
jgi:hypothetical protein